MEDIFGAVKPLLYASKIVGLGPFFVDEQAKSLKISVYGMIYTFGMIALVGGNSGFVMYYKIRQNANDIISGGGTSSYIGQFADTVLLGCGILVSLCVLTVTIIQRNKIISMVRCFHEIDSKMYTALEVRMPYRRAFWYSCGTIAFLLCVVCLLIIHDTLISFTGVVVAPSHFWITYFSPIIASILMEYQFISGGFLLKKNFVYLNESLIKFGDNSKCDIENDQKKLELMSHNAGHDRYFESHLTYRSPAIPITAWDGNFSRFRMRKVSPSDGTVMPKEVLLAKIKAIRKIHNSLCEIKELLNSTYSLQLLSAVAQAFVMITSNLYNLFTSASNANGGHREISYPIIWASFHTIELICIVLTCTKTSKTANHTAVIVHKLLARDWDSNIRNQLKLFSIQLLHRKISFSACGFFTIDMTLLHAIIGAATTYLVILIQFHNSYESS